MMRQPLLIIIRSRYKIIFLLTDCIKTSALNEQFIANLVLLRFYPSENASESRIYNFTSRTHRN